MQPATPKTRSRTFLKPLAAAFLTAYVLPLVALFALLAWETTGPHADGYGQERHSLVSLAVVALLGTVGGLVVLLAAGLRMRREIRHGIERLERMLAGDRRMLHGMMPAGSANEVGRLSEAFNELQTRAAGQHAAIELELQLAYQVQSHLLPAIRADHGSLTIAASCLQTKEVGGDLYDLAPAEGGRMAVMVGDVAGKGLPAALVMTAALALFRRELSAGGGPGEVLGRMNRVLAGSLRGETYITMVVAEFDPAESVVRIASAGHMAACLRSGETWEEVELPSYPLGVFEGSVFAETVKPFPPGSRCVLYTDGVIEGLMARAEDAEASFNSWLSKIAEWGDGVAAPQALERLMAGMRESPGGPYSDDSTVVIIEHVPG